MIGDPGAGMERLVSSLPSTRHLTVSRARCCAVRGLYSSRITEWCKARDAGALAGGPVRAQAQPRALSAAEQQTILDVLDSGRFVDVAGAEGGHLAR
ncbi:hypothetical protein MGAST_07680 [Mycobacterium gastri 'Wayne']|uniref:Uncharacterized protein n=1 Tax=Mycobacterium gastri TaxID=1777 RepID=A0A1X1VZ28_MYCGS|nr:hypothetical protein MGAST_07680 [Mycobacterium gastri 'Wayne']ORV75558.1 hypothetical protein AWC07_23005 [Mycobacterium gastri]